MKRKILLLLPFLFLAIMRCEKPKRRRRDLDRKTVKSEKRPSVLYRMIKRGVIMLFIAMCFVIIFMVTKIMKKNMNLNALLSKRRVNNLSKEDQAFYDEIIKNDPYSLHYASYFGDLKAVERLLGKSQDVDARNNAGYTALCYAVKNNNKEVAELLLKKGADPNVKKIYGGDPLDYLFWEGCIEIVTLFFGHRTEMEMGNFSLLYIACLEKNFDMVELLLKNGADVNAKIGSDNTALSIASFYGCVKIVRILLEKNGINVNDRGVEKWTALHMACEAGSNDVVNLLLERDDIEVNTKSDSGKTPLHAAVLHCNYNTVRHLLKKSQKAKGVGKGPPVDCVVMNGKDIVKILFKEGENIDINTKSNEGQTALYLACNRDKIEVAKLLVSYGANVNIEDDKKVTPLKIIKKKENSTLDPTTKKKYTELIKCFENKKVSPSQ